MQADTKRNASRENLVNIMSPMTVVLVASGAKKIRVCVETTAACLTGRIASMWSSRFRVPSAGASVLTNRSRSLGTTGPIRQSFVSPALSRDVFLEEHGHRPDAQDLLLNLARGVRR